MSKHGRFVRSPLRDIAHKLLWRLGGGYRPSQGRLQILAHLARLRYGLSPAEREWYLLERSFAHVLYDQTVFDIGANYGVYTWLLARLVGPQGRVYAFEPYPDAAHALALGLRIFGFKNVNIIPEAVGNYTGTVRLDLPTSESGGVIHGLIHVQENPEGQGPCVPITSIDDFSQKRSVEEVALIKIDVEGYELNVLKGAACTIARCKPWIICEIEPQWCSRYGFAPEHVYRYVSELGPYATYVTDAQYNLIGVQGLVPGINNYVFAPLEGRYHCGP